MAFFLTFIGIGAFIVTMGIGAWVLFKLIGLAWRVLRGGVELVAAFGGGVAKGWREAKAEQLVEHKNA